MYEVHMEWQTRGCPVGIGSLTGQFRRYFDRFEGRIREPPFAVYDDLAYTQGSPIEKFSRPNTERDIGNVGGMITGPNLDEYRERLRGFAMDLVKEDVTQEVLPPATTELSATDLAEIYNFPIMNEQLPPLPPVPAAGNYNQRMEDSLFSNLDPFTAIPETRVPRFPPSLSPFELGSIHSTSSHQSTATTMGQPSEELLDFPFDEGDIGFENLDLFGDMPDMPGLDGVIDRGFLEFLDTQQ
jgi:hypothetical protein